MGVLKQGVQQGAVRRFQGVRAGYLDQFPGLGKPRVIGLLRHGQGHETQRELWTRDLTLPNVRCFASPLTFALSESRTGLVIHNQVRPFSHI